MDDRQPTDTDAACRVYDLREYTRRKQERTEAESRRAHPRYRGHHPVRPAPGHPAG
jgi:hypothetical protein